MLTHDQLPDDTRVWIYQADRNLSDHEVREMRYRLREFIRHWSAHGEKMSAAGEVFYNRFLVIFANEAEVRASGCSIDASVRFVRQLAADYGVSLLDTMLVTYRDGDAIKSCSREEFREKLDNGEINEDTIVFNNLVPNKQGLRQNWEVPVRNSWHRQLVAR